MASVKISELPAVSTTIVGTDLIEVSKDLGGGSYQSQKATAANIGTYIQNNVTAATSSYSLTASYAVNILTLNQSYIFNKSNKNTASFSPSGNRLVTQVDFVVGINTSSVLFFTASSNVNLPTTMLAGNDYGIYATTDGKLIATIATSSFLEPDGYNSSTSMLVGGFYYAHNGTSPITTISESRVGTTSYVTASSGHGLSTGDYVDVTLMTDTTFNVVNIPVTVNGNIISYENSGSNTLPTRDSTGRIWNISTSGSINPYSIWDLKFRPSALDPRGMVLVDNRFWVDIWLTGVNYHVSGSSKKGERIADGENSTSRPVRSPALGGDGTAKYSSLNWWEAGEVLSYVGKSLPCYEDFTVAMYGTTENNSFGTDPVVNCRTIGYISKWGVEEATGVMWVWGKDLVTRWDYQTTVNSTYRSRTGNIALITSSAAHGLQSGDVINTTSFGSSSYNRTMTTVLTTPSTTTFTFNASGPDESLTSDSAGRINYGMPTFGYQNVAGSRGQIYIQGSYGLCAGLFGGFWSNGAFAGSRRSIWSSYVWNSDVSVGCRGFCDHKILP
jgi:hypothetical protein